tara:strand:+ start:1268 stop:1903 length:636 start_codon:yes stop_codon:yes gene_type:complete
MKLTSIILLALFQISGTPKLMIKPTPVKVWKENDGILVIEVENHSDKKSPNVKWELKKESKGFSGTGYYQWTGVGIWHKIDEYASMASERILSYTFEINKKGIYYAKIKNFHLMEDGDNDVYLSINKSSWNKIYDHQKENWTWDENGQWNDKYPQYLKKGIYQIELAGRSQGFAIDKIALFHESHSPDPWTDCESTIWADSKESKTYYTND